MKLVLLVLFLLAACDRATGTPLPPSPSVKPMTNPDVDLKWSLTKSPDGQRLIIEYTLQNKTAQKIFVADKLLAYHGGQIRLVPDRVIVTADSEANVVRLVRGVVSTRTTQFDHPPGATAVEPGATHKGSASVPLPLKGWHNYAPPPSIPSAPQRAVLEIAYLTGSDIEWGAVKTADGVDVTIPQLPSYRSESKFARADVKPIP